MSEINWSHLIGTIGDRPIDENTASVRGRQRAEVKAACCDSLRKATFRSSNHKTQKNYICSLFKVMKSFT